MNSAISSWEWMASSYAQHSSVQQMAAQTLLQKVSLVGSEDILDIGCGDGKITAAIARRVPNGSVLGLDKSSKMIAYAQQHLSLELYPNLRFVQGEAQRLAFCMEYDVVFSSFALQWCSDLQTTFRGIRRSLKPHGRLVATIPLSISSQLERSLKIVTNSSDWARYFSGGSSGVQLRDADVYASVIRSSGFRFQRWSIVDQEALFSGRTEFKEYISQWLPHLACVPVGMREMFLQSLVEQYVAESSERRSDGKLSFVFSRLDLVCEAIATRREGVGKFVTTVPDGIGAV